MMVIVAANTPNNINELNKESSANSAFIIPASRKNNELAYKNALAIPSFFNWASLSVIISKFQFLFFCKLLLPHLMKQ